MLFAFQCGRIVPSTALTEQKYNEKKVQKGVKKTYSGTQTFPSHTGISSQQIKNNHIM
jgi:hypothetical protein